MVTAICSGPAQCCVAAGLSFDTEACIAELEPYAVARLNTGVCAGGVIDPVVLDGCVTKVETYGKKCVGYTAEAYAADAACEHVAAGTKPHGAPCTSEVECNAGPNQEANCSSSSSGDTCSIETIVPVGASCTSPDVKCNTGAEEICQDGTCQPKGAVGAPCSTSTCVEAAYCNAGTCAAKKPTGAPCTNSTECEVGSACINQTCGGVAGASCSSSSECAGDCVAGTCAPVLSWFVSLLASGHCTP